MKITKTQINKAIAALQAANRTRTERVITETQLLDLIKTAETTYKEYKKEKYFHSVKIQDYGTWRNKPNAYNYRAENTHIIITIAKNKSSITIYSQSWGYIPVSAKMVEIEYC